MTRAKFGLALAGAAMLAGAATANDVLGMRLYYDERNRGYVAVPDQDGPAPGVLLVHDWSGLDGGELVAARKWAEAGYAVMAIDLFAGETFESRAAAQPTTRALLARGAERRVARNLRSGLAYLKDMAEVDPTRIAIVGYEFGGAMSIYAATEEFGLQAAVAYEAPSADYAKAPIAAPLLLLTAAPPTEEEEAIAKGAADARSALVAVPNVEAGFTTGKSAAAEAAFSRGVSFLAEVMEAGAQ